MRRELRLPDRTKLPEIFSRLAIDERDAREIVAAWPARPERVPFLADAYAALANDMGGFAHVELPIPPPDTQFERYFYVFVFLALLGDVRRFHAGRGIPDDVAWATLADLGRNLRRDRELFGEGGLRTVSWLALHFRGAIYDLGRLQFNRMLLRAVHAADGLREGQNAIGVHIPETGPLSPESCDESLDRARTFFARHFPETPTRIAVCASWLLDPQLSEYLQPDSNILRFQRRFRLLGEGYEGDEDIVRFIFKRIAPIDLEALPRRTTLERAIVAHLRAGRHWRSRVGWLELG